ncbi:MAG: hypothetical protein CMD53_04245 [Gammaproteobacteria bacterium]|jgi:para-nitrobenzyl esterase|nr:hypothetical protein [Gammaproteobacteria bacterium]HJL96232.1 carboxylesterase family protein [SAR86 cluster bacterium]HJM58959.1 carboxylesterase family protein [SAR86 cluster bacterium]|tara:strand:- start:3096 stop:4700 length:1605 start_codon:yes stop_codon:yes gene_type:complete
MNIKKIISFIFIAYLISCSDSTQVETQVHVTGGLIEGSKEGTLKKYLGIPYAAAPVNELRWAPPKEVSLWTGRHLSKEYSKICYQPKQSAEFYNRGPSLEDMSEDCLTLNVWTRAERANEKLPVMVWIHGGALVWGSGREYPGQELTKKGIILVTINYRLGPFGFFAHPELTQENETSGNQGYRDQVAALKWVKDNISSFGGDPDNVTIFGESAGSWSVNVLQASPLASGLFHKVIGQSGARLIPLTHINKKSSYSDSGESLGVRLSEIMALSEQPSLEELRSLSPIQIIQNIEKDPLYRSQFDSLTVIDGEVIPEDISSIFKKGDQANVPTLIGSTADEATTFDPKMLNPGITGNLSYVDLTKSSVSEILPEANDEIFKYYPINNEKEAKESWINFTTDAMFTAQMQKWGQLMASVDSPTFLYLWDWHPTVNSSKKFKAFHAAEVPYVFGRFDMFGIEATEEDYVFSNTMMDMWTNFAKTGNPSIKDSITWPEYESSNQVYMLMGESISIDKNLRSKKVSLINEAYDKAREEF